MKSGRNIALVHDWLVRMRGGEKVLEVLCDLFPEATLFTLIHSDEGNLSSPIRRMSMKTSFLQHIPFGRSHYQHYLPVFPMAARSLDVRGYDLVISSSHAAAKGVRVRPDALHVCYCHTPMRYIWDQYDRYFASDSASLPVRVAMKLVRPYLQRWDISTAQKVTQFIANSCNVQERIRRIYGRESVVIYPPVDVASFPVSTRDEGYFLVVSALVPYKRIDLAVEAFNRLGKRLVIVGAGSEEARLKARAKGNIDFVGWVNDDILREYYAGCRALVFPGEEDFGIVPVEAMACGKPVIAYARGGALETVIEGETGLFFGQPEPAAIERCIRLFDNRSFNTSTIRANAERFSRETFVASFRSFLHRFIDTAP